MKTKEEVIRDAWGIYHGDDLQDIPSADMMYINCRLNTIEQNNGWIKIESEEDLPKNEIQCYVLVENNIELDLFNGNDFDFYNIEYVTHYQPIVKPLPPLY